MELVAVDVIEGQGSVEFRNGIKNITVKQFKAYSIDKFFKKL